MQRILAIGIGRCAIGAAFKQLRNLFRHAAQAGKIQRRIAGHRLVDVGAMLQQLFKHLGMRLADGRPQCGSARTRRNFCIGAVFDQQSHHIGLALAAGMDQGRAAFFVELIDGNA